MFRFIFFWTFLSILPSRGLVRGNRMRGGVSITNEQQQQQRSSNTVLPQEQPQDDDSTTTLTTTLSNNTTFPLVGMGVGNLQPEYIVDLISGGMVHGGFQLIDTAHASRNEDLVHEGIMYGGVGSADAAHVVTKVWYTYLGYERTKLSVKASLENLPNIKVHVLLHWPYCRDDIPWMQCEREEAALPQVIKDAGPPPHLHKETAFIESWRALEDMYLSDEYPIASIGVSNFDLQDWKQLMQSKPRITPHVHQGNVWTFVFDPYLMDYLQEKRVVFQAFNVMNGIVSQYTKGPRAHQSLQSVAQQLGDTVTPTQVVLRWLIQNKVSVIPRTSSVEHLHENSPNTLSKIPPLTEEQQDKVRAAVKALLQSQDLPQPKAIFTNAYDAAVHLFWTSADGTEVAVKENLQPGESYPAVTYPGHVFVAYFDESKEHRKEYLVSANYGAEEQFHIEL